MDILYKKYVNIQKLIVNYRKYEMKDKFYNFEVFKKTIHVDQYVKHDCIDTVKEVVVYVYLFSNTSKYIKTTAQFKRLMDKLPTEPANVIIITKDPLNVYINKAIIKYPHLNISNYLHKYFAIEITHGPLCSPHTILSDAEVRTLCARDLIIHPLSLPSISINDPQNIWVGGDLGQIIKIDSISEITGKTLRYRIVTPDSGKLISTRKLRESVPTNTELIKSVKSDREKKAKDKADKEQDDLEEYIDETDDADETDDETE